MEVYGLFGHGCDIITDREDTTDRPMPADCIYVTIIMCGLYSHHLGKLIYAFNDPYIKEALKNPIENLEKLNYYFTMRHRNIGTEPIIHIHAAGTPADTYVDSINTLIYNDIVNENTIYRSGLYKLGAMKPIPLNGRHVPGIPEGVDESLIDKIGLTGVTFTGAIERSGLTAIYDGSLIQPVHLTDPATGAPFASVNEFTRVNDPLIRVNLSTLFAARPGIYYNFACRPACEVARQAGTEGRRIRSRNKQATAGHYVRLGHDMAPLIPAPEVIAAVDYRVARRMDDWLSERYRITNEFIISKRRRSARESQRRAGRIRNLEALRTSRRSATKKLRGAKGAKGRTKTRTLGRHSRSRA